MSKSAGSVRNRRITFSLVLLGIVAAIAGCAQPRASDSGRGDVNLAPLRQVHYDYKPALSPEELIREGKHDVIVAGLVKAILPGRQIREERGEKYPVLHVAMEVEVTDRHRTTRAGQIINGSVFVEFFQGPRSNTDGAPLYSLEDWRAAVPQGTKVMLFLHEDQGPDGQLVTTPEGVPPSARLLIPGPQGIFLEDDGRLVGGIDELVGEWTGIRSVADLNQRAAAALTPR